MTQTYFVTVQDFYGRAAPELMVIESSKTKLDAADEAVQRYRESYPELYPSLHVVVESMETK